MIYLILAVISSTAISVVMRLSDKYVKNNMTMFASNYLICGLLSFAFLMADSGEYFHHTHAAFSFDKDGTHTMQGGHMKSTTVLYTAEIELRPVIGGRIGRKPDPETGTGFWDFSNKHDSVV